jgi:hypothetical protein
VSVLSINEDIRKQFKFTDDELLYDKNSINILYENIELLEILRQSFKRNNPEHVERRNSMLIFELVIKYCQYCETLGAIINGFELSNRNENPSSTIVLSQVGAVTDFFRDFFQRL